MHQPLAFWSLPYDPQLLATWKKGDYTFLQDSDALGSIKNALTSKAHTRLVGRRREGHPEGDGRFFGEAVVATKLRHRAGWYASFKWLTAECWHDGHEIDGAGFRGAFGQALKEHISMPVLLRLRERADLLRLLLGGKIPVPPDLWLFTGRKHRFIEVKMPKDRLGDSQLAGFAVLATALEGRLPISLEVVELYPEGAIPKRRGWEAAQEQFERLCGVVRRRAVT